MTSTAAARSGPAISKRSTAIKGRILSISAAFTVLLMIFFQADLMSALKVRSASRCLAGSGALWLARVDASAFARSFVTDPAAPAPTAITSRSRPTSSGRFHPRSPLPADDACHWVTICSTVLPSSLFRLDASERLFLAWTSSQPPSLVSTAISSSGASLSKRIDLGFAPPNPKREFERTLSKQLCTEDRADRRLKGNASGGRIASALGQHRWSGFGFRGRPLFWKAPACQSLAGSLRSRPCDR